jgi:CHAD domain-containing protein
MRMKSPRVKKVAQNSEDTLKMPVELRVTEKSEMTLDGEMICPTFVLREQVTAFEAAMAIVLAGPEKKAVHKLRASTRRVEAQLLLLSLMGHGEKTFGKPYRKLLKEVRRACGRARDCDVELDLLDELVAGLVAGESDELRAQVETLRLTLIAKRERRANELTKDLQGHARKLPARLEALLKALKPAEDERLEPARLEELTRQWYADNADPEANVGSEDSGEEALHEVRKRAKLARFLLESGGGRMSKQAREFESVQDCGGIWHDLLTLTANAVKRLGKKAELTQLLEARESIALAVFRAKLKAFG